MSVQTNNDTAAIARLNSVFASQKKAFLENSYPSLKERLDLIGAVIPMMMANRKNIQEALASDFGSHSTVSADFIEVLGQVMRAQYNMEQLEGWMADQDKHMGAEVMGSGEAFVRYHPKGVIGNMVPWNFPFDIAVGPMMDMLAAGNRVILKPSDMTPACGELLESMIRSTYSEDQVAVVNGGLDLARHFSSLAWDHLLYTGNIPVGKEVMKAAAENLTPVTLELGGKCPAIITEDKITAETASHIAGVKSIKRGQMCVTVDYCLVPENQLDTFTGLMQTAFAESLTAENGVDEAAGIINDRHIARLNSLLTEARESGATVIQATNDAVDADKRNMPFSIVVNPSDDIELMKNEIFGPILAVKTYKTLDEAIAYVNAGERPLGLYVFSDDANAVNQVTNNTVSGGVSVNSASLQAAWPSLPFGGAGASGMGRHHGEEGFREFSVPRGFFKAGQEPSPVLPPFGEMQKQILAQVFPEDA